MRRAPPRQTITPKEWQEAGLPFDLWLRYAGSSEKSQRRTEYHFTLKHRSEKT